eukprot:TRINITY_DN40045_c0_g1_i4.p1 TRINITY_DN40045_c0_g1~~TRINITY_DN40045_c0_g1_i4.p1  ORF type:complete len:1266 (+),score=168.68 TRINITY_DN40045_c0_g1_i4:57-3800(+)
MGAVPSQVGAAVVAALLLAARGALGSAPCPSGWSLMQGYCYYAVGSKMSSDNAQSQCNSLGGDLARIEKQAQNAHVRWLADQVASSSGLPIWIGLSDRIQEAGTDGSSSDWRWCDNSGPAGLFRPWASGEPRADSAGHDCVRQVSSEQWEVRNCNVPLNFACTQPAVTSGPTAAPSVRPSQAPSANPSSPPSTAPSAIPTLPPTAGPSKAPSTAAPSAAPAPPTAAPVGPTPSPSRFPSAAPAPPTAAPSGAPSQEPSMAPSSAPSLGPSPGPSAAPAPPTAAPVGPTQAPSAFPSGVPANPTRAPSSPPSLGPSVAPSPGPSAAPAPPTAAPLGPTQAPSEFPTATPVSPTRAPSSAPSQGPSHRPSQHPSPTPTVAPRHPSGAPTQSPTQAPSPAPSLSPSSRPSTHPSPAPAAAPTLPPSASPSGHPTAAPTAAPSVAPCSPSTAPAHPTSQPSQLPTQRPSGQPSRPPSVEPSAAPSLAPTVSPSAAPAQPTEAPSGSVPTAQPSRPPSASPIASPPSAAPTAGPFASLPTGSPAPGPTARPSARPSASAPVEPSAAPLPPTVRPTTRPTTRPTAAPRPAAVRTTQTPSAAPSTAPTGSPSEWPFKNATAQQGLDFTASVLKVEGAVSVFTNLAPGLVGLALLNEDQCGHDAHHYGGYGDDDLSILMHPLQFSVSGDVYVGCIAGNLVVAGVCAVVLLAARFVVRPLLRHRGMSPLSLETQAAIPSIFFSLFIFLYQGSAYATAHVLLRSGESDAPRIAAGCLGLAGLVITVPTVTWLVVLRHLHEEAVWETDGTKSFLLGAGEWCSRGESRWHKRFAMCVWPYKPPHQNKAVIAQFIETFALSLLAGLKKHTFEQCAWAHGGYTAVVLLHGAWAMRMLPFARPRDTVWETLVSAFTIAAMAVRMAAYSSMMDGQKDTEGHFNTASTLLCLGVVVTLVKLAVDVWCWARVSSWRLGTCERVGRREELQQQAWQRIREGKGAEAAASGSSSSPSQTPGSDATGSLCLSLNDPTSVGSPDCSPLLVKHGTEREASGAARRLSGMWRSGRGMCQTPGAPSLDGAPAGPGSLTPALQPLGGRRRSVRPQTERHGRRRRTVAGGSPAAHSAAAAAFEDGSVDSQGFSQGRSVRFAPAQRAAPPPGLTLDPGSAADMAGTPAADTPPADAVPRYAQFPRVAADVYASPGPVAVGRGSVRVRPAGRGQRQVARRRALSQPSQRLAAAPPERPGSAAADGCPGDLFEFHSM